MFKVIVEVELAVPKRFKGVGRWSREESLASFVRHWLTEGYYSGEYSAELPEGIRYKGFRIRFPEGWGKEGGE